MGRKKLPITVLFSVVLLTLAFIPISTQQSASDYDPWNDINDDGKIDIKDVASTAIKFGTSGDPAKNVTIVGYATVTETEWITIPAGGFHYKYIDTQGYRQISVGFDGTATIPFNIIVSWHVSGGTYQIDSFTNNGRTLKVYEVQGQRLQIYINNLNTVTENIYVDYYITA